MKLLYFESISYPMRKKLQRPPPESSPSDENELTVSIDNPDLEAEDVEASALQVADAPLRETPDDDGQSSQPTMRHSDARPQLTTVGGIQTAAPEDPYQPTNQRVELDADGQPALGKQHLHNNVASEVKPVSAPIRVADDDGPRHGPGLRNASGPPVVTEDQAQVIPRPAKRSIMTAPFGHDRRARMFAAGFGQAQDKPKEIDDVHNFFSVRQSLDSKNRSEQLDAASNSQAGQSRGGLSNCYVEGDLLKATNIYQQFDRKGNIFENRLYAKTSINQAKLNKQQATFVQKMDDLPEEICRIQNGTMTMNSQEEMYRTMGTNQSRAGPQGAFSGTAISAARSQQSQSVSNMGRSAVISNGMSSPGIERKSVKNRTTLATGRFKASSQQSEARCTFSRANGPRIAKADMTSNPVKPYVDKPAGPGLFQRLQNETQEMYKSQTTTKSAKNAWGSSLRSANKSLQKLRTMKRYVQNWSNNDQNMRTTTRGIGGAANTFRSAQNFVTNDPRMYKTSAPVHESRYAKLGLNSAMDEYVVTEPIDQPYVFGASGGMKTQVYLNAGNLLGTSNEINQPARVFYSTMLDGKGSSRVFNFTSAAAANDAAAGAPSQIQKKAYRANTQSRQVDGLYNPEKFTKRVNMSNHSRVHYNILRPVETTDVSMRHMTNAQVAVDNIRKGQCHQVYGISDFSQNARLGALKLHEGYQAAFGKDEQAFRRTNGEFTAITDQLKTCNLG